MHHSNCRRNGVKFKKTCRCCPDTAEEEPVPKPHKKNPFRKKSSNYKTTKKWIKEQSANTYDSSRISSEEESYSSSSESSFHQPRHSYRKAPHKVPNHRSSSRRKHDSYYAKESSVPNSGLRHIEELFHPKHKYSHYDEEYAPTHTKSSKVQKSSLKTPRHDDEDLEQPFKTKNAGTTMDYAPEQNIHSKNRLDVNRASAMGMAMGMSPRKDKHKKTIAFQSVPGDYYSSLPARSLSRKDFKIIEDGSHEIVNIETINSDKGTQTLKPTAKSLLSQLDLKDNLKTKLDELKPSSKAEKDERYSFWKRLKIRTTSIATWLLFVSYLVLILAGILIAVAASQRQSAPSSPVRQSSFPSFQDARNRNVDNRDARNRNENTADAFNRIRNTGEVRNRNVNTGEVRNRNVNTAGEFQSARGRVRSRVPPTQQQNPAPSFVPRLPQNEPQKFFIVTEAPEAPEVNLGPDVDYFEDFLDYDFALGGNGNSNLNDPIFNVNRASAPVQVPQHTVVQAPAVPAFREPIFVSASRPASRPVSRPASRPASRPSPPIHRQPSQPRRVTTINQQFTGTVVEETARGRKEPEVKILNSWSFTSDDGTFEFGYINTDGSFKNETKGVDCVVRGVYGYVDQDTGQTLSFPYVSGNPCTGERTTSKPFHDDEFTLPLGREPVQRRRQSIRGF